MELLINLVEQYLSMGHKNPAEIHQRIKNRIKYSEGNEIVKQFDVSLIEKYVDMIRQSWVDEFDVKKMDIRRAELINRANMIEKCAWGEYQDDNAKSFGKLNALRLALSAQERQAKLMKMEMASSIDDGIHINSDNTLIINQENMNKIDKNKLKKIVKLQNEIDDGQD